MACINENYTLIDLSSNIVASNKDSNCAEMPNKIFNNSTGSDPIKICDGKVLFTNGQLYNLVYYNSGIYPYTLGGLTDYIIDDFDENFAIIGDKIYCYSGTKLNFVKPIAEKYQQRYCDYYIINNQLHHYKNNVLRPLLITVDKILHVAYVQPNIIFCVANDKLLIVTLHKNKIIDTIYCNDIVAESIKKFAGLYMLDIYGNVYQFSHGDLMKLHNEILYNDICVCKFVENRIIRGSMLYLDAQNNIYSKNFKILIQNCIFEKNKVGTMTKSANKICAITL
jgi:hypothetical protein